MFVYCADYVKKHSFLHRCAFLLHFKKVDYQVGKKEKHFFFNFDFFSILPCLREENFFFFSKPLFPFKRVLFSRSVLTLIIAKFRIHTFCGWQRNFALCEDQVPGNEVVYIYTIFFVYTVPLTNPILVASNMWEAEIKILLHKNLGY